MAELQADFAKGMTLHQIADTKGLLYVPGKVEVRAEEGDPLEVTRGIESLDLLKHP